MIAKLLKRRCVQLPLAFLAGLILFSPIPGANAADNKVVVLSVEDSVGNPPPNADISIQVALEKVTNEQQSTTYSAGNDPNGVISYQDSSGSITIVVQNFDEGAFNPQLAWEAGDELVVEITANGESGDRTVPLTADLGVQDETATPIQLSSGADNTPPTVSNLTVSNPADLNSTVTIEADITDAEGSVDSVEYAISQSNPPAAGEWNDGTGDFSGGSLSTDVALTDTNFSAGSWTVFVRATDDNSNTTDPPAETALEINDPAALTLAITPSADQEGFVDKIVNSFTATVTDSGNPVEGETVQQRSGTDGDVVFTASDVTNSNGEVSFTWALASNPGDQSLTLELASDNNVSDTINATAFLGTIAKAATDSGDNQSGTFGEDLPSPIRVELTDGDGNPVGGQATAISGSGDGTVSAFTETATAGTYEATWTLAASGDTQTVQVEAANYQGSPLTFTASASASTQSLTITDGNAQSASAGSVLPNPIEVTITEDGTPVTGEAANISATPSGNGSVTAFSEQGTSGVYTAEWTLGDTVGQQTLSIAGTGALADFPTAQAVAQATCDASASFFVNSIDNDNLVVIFEVADATNIATFDWNFGTDGTQTGGTDEAPEVTYSTAGSKTVRLTVTSTSGCQSGPFELDVNLQGTVDCSAQTPPNFDVVAVDETTDTAPVVTLNASGISDVAQYTWTFDASFNSPFTGANPATLTPNQTGGTDDQPEFTYTYTPGTDSPIQPITLTVAYTNGCQASITRLISIDADRARMEIENGAGGDLTPFTVGFAATPTSGALDTLVKYVNQTTAPADGFTPFFTPEEGGTTLPPGTDENTYATGGSFNAEMFVDVAGTGPGAGAYTATVPIQISALDFSGTPLAGFAPLTVSFTDETTGATSSDWEWDFENDGTPDDTTQNPSFTYDIPGTYSVTLKASLDGATPKDELTKVDYIVVQEDPTCDAQAAFTAPGTLNAGTAATFTNTSTGVAAEGDTATWLWEVEPATGVTITDNTAKDAEITFPDQGQYTVRLIATGTSPNDCVTTAEQTVTVDPSTTCDVTANFSPTTATVNQPVTFSAASATGPIATYSWDLGNDDTEDGTGQTYQVTFDSTGNFQLELTVTSQTDGCEDSILRTIVVSTDDDDDDNGGGGGGFVPSPPSSVDFMVEGFEDADTIEIAAGTILQFNEDAIGETTYRWDFGDDSTSTDRNPTHAYNEPGSYDVSLRVSNSGGTRTESKEAFIVVSPLEASFTAEPEEGRAPLNVTFTDTTQIDLPDPAGDNEVSREWMLTNPEGDEQTVGNGAASFSQELTMDGEYTMELTVSNNEVQDSATRTINVTDGDMLEADFTCSVVNGLNISCTDLSEPADQIALRSWDFGDQVGTATGSNVTYTYGGSGTYTVTLNVVSFDNQTDEATQEITVEAIPQGEINAAFSATPTSGTAPLSVSFTDQSTATNGITLWQWDFDNDGEVDSTNNPQPTFVYNDAGTFTATLTVTGPDGTDTATQSITVDPVVPPEEDINPPEGQQPANGATDVSLNPTLMIGPFDDPDSQYGATQWQIAIDPNFAEMFLIWDQIKDDGTDDDFMLMIPDFILENGPATYYWRARFIDANGEFSPWSDIYTFSTIATEPEDADDDGVDDGEEVDDPLSVFPGLDPNNPLVLYVRAAEGDGFWALEGVENVAGLIRLKAYTVGEAGVGLPPNTTMPLGLIGYKLQTLNAGDEAKVRVHFNPAATANSAWFAFLGVQGWQEFSGTTAVFGDDMASVMLTLQDGGFGDLDGIANGIIIVPLSGFGVVEAEIIEGGGGGSDTCFISAATEKPWAAVVLMTLVAAAALAIRRSPIR